MKKQLVMIAVGSLGIASSAMAGVGVPPNGGTEVINLANFSFATQSTTSYSAVQTQVVNVTTNPNNIIGFKFEFDYTESPSDASYASDIGMHITGPGFPFPGGDWTIGSGSYNAWTFGPRDELWDFQGAGSTAPGHYSHTTFVNWQGQSVPRGGQWTIDFQAAYNAGTSYSNVVLTLYKAPAPGGLALLGLAGVLGTSRRRRA
jgi:hypothetical protein